MSYVSLHTHTTYSLLDSTSSPVDFISKAKEFGMSAIAFTEHGNLYNWIKKKQYCDKAGIKYSSEIGSRLIKEGKVVRICKNKKDPDDLNREEMIDAMEENRDN